MNIAGIIDHTLLSPAATNKDIDALCSEAVKYGFCSVCVNPSFVAYASKYLKAHFSGAEPCKVKVASVIGFPLGATTTGVKCFEAKASVDEGADELDMVINIGRLKSGDYDYVASEIAAVKNAVQNKILKVIIETCLLTKDEIVAATKLAAGSGADFVKTSTGFSTSGASAGDVALMRAAAGDKVGVKASGGIRTYKAAIEMVSAGANRLGLSNSVAIMKEYDRICAGGLNE